MSAVQGPLHTHGDAGYDQGGVQGVPEGPCGPGVAPGRRADRVLAGTDAQADQHDQRVEGQGGVI